MKKETRKAEQSGLLRRATESVKKALTPKPPEPVTPKPDPVAEAAAESARIHALIDSIDVDRGRGEYERIRRELHVAFNKKGL
jgi:hypothetical protein